MMIALNDYMFTKLKLLHHYMQRFIAYIIPKNDDFENNYHMLMPDVFKKEMGGLVCLYGRLFVKVRKQINFKAILFYPAQS